MLKSDSDTSGTSHGALWALFSAPAVGPGPCRGPADQTQTLVGARGRGSLLPARPQPLITAGHLSARGSKQARWPRAAAHAWGSVGTHGQRSVEVPTNSSDALPSAPSLTHPGKHGSGLHVYALLWEEQIPITALCLKLPGAVLKHEPSWSGREGKPTQFTKTQREKFASSPCPALPCQREHGKQAGQEPCRGALRTSRGAAGGSAPSGTPRAGAEQAPKSG